MKRVVVDTNIWIRILLAGPVTLPILEAWQSGRFQVIVSQPLLDELDEVWQRARLRQRIPEERARRLQRQLRFRGEMVAVITTPPRCRDPKDEPVLATAIDGKADVIVSGDADLRADDRLREEMADQGVEIWGGWRASSPAFRPAVGSRRLVVGKAGEPPDSKCLRRDLPVRDHDPHKVPRTQHHL